MVGIELLRADVCVVGVPWFDANDVVEDDFWLFAPDFGIKLPTFVPLVKV